MSEQSSETPRTTYQAPTVEEIGQIHEVGERKAWELGNEPAPVAKTHDARTA